MKTVIATTILKFAQGNLDEVCGAYGKHGAEWIFFAGIGGFLLAAWIFGRQQ